MTIKYSEKQTVLKERIREMNLFNREEVIDDYCHFFTPMVKKLAIKYSKRSKLSEEDFFQEGMTALISAFPKIKLLKNTSITTYVYYKVIFALQLLKGQMDKSFTSKFNDVKLLNKILKLQQDGLSENEILNSLNIDSLKMQKLLGLSEQDISIFSEVPDADKVTLNDLVSSNDLNPEELMIKEAKQKSLYDSLKKALKINEFKIISENFGLFGKKAKTLAEIAKEINLTKQRVQQIKEGALKKLKDNEKVIEVLN